MKVLILSVGTRGDVQPFLALALALRAAGHEVVVACPGRFAGLAAEHEVELVELDDGPMRLLDGAEARGAFEGGPGTRARQLRALPSMFTRLLEECAEVALRGRGAGADVVVHNGQVLAGQHVAEALGVPAVLGLPLPLYVPTRSFPWPGAPLPRWWPAAANRASYAGMRLPAVAFARAIDRWRTRTLGLPRRPGRHNPLQRTDGGHAPVLHAFSPQVVAPASDWPQTVSTTGFWVLPGPPAALPERVRDFLAAGDPPVYAGFGSMTSTDPIAAATAVRQAARRVGARLVLATGSGALSGSGGSGGFGHDGDERVLVVDQVDHRSLLPHTAAVIHHGGAGTTAAAVLAGRAQVVCPFAVDQPFWARRVHALGVAAPPLPQRHLDADALTAALGTVLGDRAITSAAEELGQRVRAEDGTGDATMVLEQSVRR